MTIFDSKPFISSAEFHRNGVGGEPFVSGYVNAFIEGHYHVFLVTMAYDYTDPDAERLDPLSCRVVELAQNPGQWRGDLFGEELAQRLYKHARKRADAKLSALRDDASSRDEES